MSGRFCVLYFLALSLGCQSESIAVLYSRQFADPKFCLYLHQMKWFCIFFLVSGSFGLYAQTEDSTRVLKVAPRVSVPEKGNKETILFDGESEAEFPGGVLKLAQFIKDHVHYPEGAMDVSGKVYIQFVVEVDGTLREIEVIRAVHPLLDAEALRVVHSMPRWIPGTLDGKKVRTWVRLPVVFKAD